MIETVAGSRDNPSIRRISGETAVVVSLPHGGTLIPKTMAEQLVPRQEHLWSDWYTLDLYGSLPEVGVTQIENHLSQFVANPNRSLNDPMFGDFWKCVVSSTDTNGHPIYKVLLTPKETDERIQIGWKPYHRSLSEAIDVVMKRYGRCLLLDLHSFGMDLPTDIVVGDRHGTSARPDLVGDVESAFVGAGFRVARNLRFSGGYIVQKFGHSSEIDAVQVELNQRTYLDPDYCDNPTLDPPQLDTQKLRQTSLRLRNAVSTIVKTYMERAER